MMKKSLSLLVLSLITPNFMISNAIAKEKAAAPIPKVPAFRAMLGPVYGPPTLYKGKIYILGSSGLLFESKDLTQKAEKIFQTKLKTVSEPVRDGNILYFGEGLHDDKESSLYAFDLDAKKLLFSVPVKGHIEKRATIVGDDLIVGLGPGGLASFNKKTGKENWRLIKDKEKTLHIDSTPILYKDSVLVGSIYDYKAILSVKIKGGAINWSTTTEKSPKSDLVVADEKVVAINSDGDLNSKNREIPSDFVVLDAKSGKQLFTKPMRGSNFFPQLVDNNVAFVSLSTGDLITIDLKTQKLTPIDQYAEPFLSSTFKQGKELCAISVMGRLFCYENFKLSRKKELGEVVIGKIVANPSVTAEVGSDKIYYPTVIGYGSL